MAFATSNFLGLHPLDWIVLSVYFIGVVVIGVWSYKKVKNLSDFFMGGRRFGKVFMMFFAFGSGTNAEQAVGVVAGTWRNGLVGIWWQFLWLWATPFYWIVAPVMRRMRALTTADFFEARYDTSTATLYSIWGIITSIVFLASGLYGAGKMVNALTGGELERVAQQANIQVPDVYWDVETTSFDISTRRVEGYEFAILAMTVLFVIYGMAGGLGAAIITDFIQGILTVTFSFLLLPFVFHMIGGFGQLHQQAHLKEGMLDLVASPEVAASLGKEPLTAFYVFMLSFTALAGIVVQPHIMGVCGAGKTEFEGRFGFTFGNFMKRFCTMAWTFTGLACVVWYMGPNSPLKDSADPQDQVVYQSLIARASPDYEKLDDEKQDEINEVDQKFADELFGRAAYEILPTVMHGLVGLLLASLLAAAMSSGDAQMVVSSGLFTENIYRRFLVREASQRHYLWVGRIAGLVIVVMALMLQATFTDVIDSLRVVIKTPAAIGISLWFGIVWRGWTPTAVWASTICSAGTWVFVAYRPDILQSWLPKTMFNAQGSLTDAWTMLIYVSVGVLSGILVSLISRRTPQAKLDHFFRLIHTPIRPGEKVETSCTLPDDPLPPGEKLFKASKDIELPKPTLIGFGGFIVAWIVVGLIIWLTKYLAVVW